MLSIESDLIDFILSDPNERLRTDGIFALDIIGL